MIGNKSRGISPQVQRSGCTVRQQHSRNTDFLERETPYEQLKTLIVEHRFRPGKQLQINELAELLRVSATPVREALVRLDAEGLIVSVPNRGFFAKPLNVKEIRNHYEHAFLIMKYSVAMGLSRSERNQVDALVAPVLENGDDGHVAPDESRKVAAFVEQLFERIVHLSQNGVMMTSIQIFNAYTHYLRLIDLEAASRAAEVWRATRELLSRMERAEAAEAIRILDDQLRGTLDVLPSLVKEAASRAYLEPDGEPPSAANLQRPSNRAAMNCIAV
jgi:DNA-binding GntR family transcriptional regulator